MVRKAAIIVLWMALTAGSEPPEKLQITCTFPNGDEGVEMIVDLQSGEWCNTRVGCTRIERAVSITSGLIVLRDDRRNPASRSSDYEEVNRVTGKYTFKSVGSFTMSSTQDCTAKPYSGTLGQQAKF